jgi:hypothetical protein
VVLEAEVAERRLAGIDREMDRSASAAVAAVGPAAGDVRLAPERDDPVAAGAGLDVDLGSVVEHRLHRSRADTQLRRGWKSPNACSSSARAASEIVSSGMRPSAVSVVRICSR